MDIVPHLKTKYVTATDTIEGMKKALEVADRKLFARESMTFMSLSKFHAECKQLIEYRHKSEKSDDKETGSRRRYMIRCMYMKLENDLIETLYANDYEIRDTMKPLFAYYHLLINYYYSEAETSELIDQMRDYLIDSLKLVRIRLRYYKDYLEPVQRELVGAGSKRGIHPFPTETEHEKFVSGELTKLSDEDWDVFRDYPTTDNIRRRVVYDQFELFVRDMPNEPLDERLMWRMFDERVAQIRTLNRELDNLSRTRNMYLPLFQYDAINRDLRVHYDYQEDVHQKSPKLSAYYDELGNLRLILHNRTCAD